MIYCSTSYDIVEMSTTFVGVNICSIDFELL